LFAGTNSPLGDLESAVRSSASSCDCKNFSTRVKFSRYQIPLLLLIDTEPAPITYACFQFMSHFHVDSGFFFTIKFNKNTQRARDNFRYLSCTECILGNLAPIVLV
jgi:hypothetical protein